jgi:hypothetical protein
MEKMLNENEMREVNLEIKEIESARKVLKERWEKDYKEYIVLGKKLKELKSKKNVNSAEGAEKRGELKREIDNLGFDWEDCDAKKVFELCKKVGVKKLDEYDEWKWVQYKSYVYVMWVELKKVMRLEDGEVVVDAGDEVLSVKLELGL